MSIEENGYTNGENGEGASREDSTAEHSFDELARGVSTGTVPRRKALRMLAASLFGGVLVAAPAGMALAAPSDNRKPGGTGCPVAGQIRNDRGKCECPATASTICGNQCVNSNCSVTGQTFNNNTCQCACPAGQQVVNGVCVPGCTGNNQVLCTPSGSTTPQCVNACSGGQELNAACECACPTTACPAIGQTRDPLTCQCACPAGQQVFEGACVPGCTGSGQVLCTPSGSTTPQCVNACSGGRELNAACECACPIGTAICGTGSNARCVDNTCGTGSTFNPNTCRCEANACAAANCEGCCGTTTSGDSICRAGTTNANCGSGGIACSACTGTGVECGTLATGVRGCCQGTNRGQCSATTPCCTGRTCQNINTVTGIGECRN